MPTLQLKLSPPLAPAVEAALALDLTRLTAECLGKRAEVTALMVETLSATRWYIGAQAEPGPTAWLEISITAGTNTPAQKADFIAAAHAALQRHLGREQPLAPASYVIVRELAAGVWGYGGQTQEARRLAATQAVQAK